MEIRVRSASFVGAYPSIAKLSDSPEPELIFVGRSNSGKSTLINALCGRKRLARTSKTPGRTQELHHYALDLIVVEQGSDKRKVFKARLVDTPGYGFAQVSKTQREKWDQLIVELIGAKRSDSCLCLIMDARRDVSDDELALRELRGQTPMFVIATKADKISRNEQAKRRARISKVIGLEPDSILLSGEGKLRENSVNCLLRVLYERSGS